jgi:hypothetical protein
MKLSALLLLAAAASACAGQNIVTFEKAAPSQDQVGQANCPVVLTSVGLTPYLMSLDTSGGSAGNRLALEFRNMSGKEIRSMEFSARILVKRSIYDLNYLPAIRLYLTAYGTRNVDDTFAQLRQLSLPEGIHPALIEGAALEQVTFADGSVWTPKNNQYCGFSPNQTLPVAK